MVYVTPEKSKAFVQIGYERDHQILRVKFSDSTTSYQADGVLDADVVGFTFAKSRGEYYVKVLKPKYSFVPVVSTVTCTMIGMRMPVCTIASLQPLTADLACSRSCDVSMSSASAPPRMRPRAWSANVDLRCA